MKERSTIFYIKYKGHHQLGGIWFEVFVQAGIRCHVSYEKEEENKRRNVYESMKERSTIFFINTKGIINLEGSGSTSLSRQAYAATFLIKKKKRTSVKTSMNL